MLKKMTLKRLDKNSLVSNFKQQTAREAVLWPRGFGSAPPFASSQDSLLPRSTSIGR